VDDATDPPQQNNHSSNNVSTSNNMTSSGTGPLPPGWGKLFSHISI
jgi:hypothetical protein